MSCRRICVGVVLAASAVVVGCAEVSLRALPDFYGGGWEYKGAPYIRAAMTLQALGQDKACERLLALAKSKSEDLDENQKVALLCRMLFAPKPGADFRRPMIGGAAFLGGTAYSDWPLEPIECVDGFPFLVTAGYMLAGHAERSASYVRYCMTNCIWNSYHWRMPTHGEKETALAKMLASEKWKRPLDERERGFLSAQIEDAER